MDEMADSLAEAAKIGCCVPSSRTELERWMIRFRGVPVGAACTCAAMPPRCEEWKNIFEEHKDSPLINEVPNVMGSLRIVTLNVLTLSRAEEREANGLRIPARQTRLASTFEACRNVACRRSWWSGKVLSWSRQKLRMGVTAVDSGCAPEGWGASTSPLSTALPRCSW